MKLVSPALEAHLAGGATTLCWCWRLTRRDGVVLGFTDHDRPLSFDGTSYEAAAGFTASELRDSIGLGVDNLEVEGALSSASLTEADLVGGAFDDARIEIYRVNWQDPAQRLLMRSGSLGEVRRSGSQFTAEVRGLAHYLQQPKGRLFQHTCDADLGDSRCKIDLNAGTYRGEGAVATASSDRHFSATGLAGFASEWFSRGRLAFTSGAASGLAYEVKLHTLAAGVATIELWQPARGPLAVGQSFVVTAGCDKHPATCRAKFSNMLNFRGFPHMPGNDVLTRFARSGARSA
jgi:uncharacterized phage protein (TIGR02218 family)